MKQYKKNIYLIIFLICGILITGCAYFSIGQRDNVEEITTRLQNDKELKIYNSSVIMGKVISNSDFNYPVMVIAHPLTFTNTTPTDFVILKKAGTFMLYLPEGQFHIYTITDFNNNAVFEQNEVSGVYKNKQKINLRTGEVRKGINIESGDSSSRSMSYPQKLFIKDDFDALTYQAANGQLMKIYDETFSMANAEAGQWRPSVFMKAFGANIYFAEKYDPNKIPVLFVHGVGGTPQNWVYFLMRLDRKRYQPWFYYYPSGIRLTLSSRLLFEKLIELKKKYKFNKMCITAHSMGGLVTRSLLTQYNFKKYDNFVKLYITFATPWSGFESADYSLTFAQKKLPNWLDVGSRSAFIKRTLRADLPPETPYYLFYGKRDTVAKGRALDERAYRSSKGKFGFNCDHDTILSNRKVFEKYNEILGNEL
ncbi:MAG: alpha/beta hydrolase [bacterium]|nr:alpha/beta hydrolase [bacterium]